MDIMLATPLTSLTFLDYPDPAEHALIINFIGCPHACPHCHNAFLQNKQGLTLAASAADSLSGRYVQFSSHEDALVEIAKQLRRVHTNKLVLQGGEPLLSGANLAFTKYLCRQPQYDVCVYTGYDVDYVRSVRLEGFTYLKCGTFDIETVRPSYKNDEEMVLASSGQEFYDHEFRQISTDGILKFAHNN